MQPKSFLLLKRNSLFLEGDSAWENNLPMSVLISSISPLIECKKSHLAIILSVVQCPLLSFCRRSGKRMMCALSLLWHPSAAKSFSEKRGEHAGWWPGNETLSQPSHAYWINFWYVSYVAKTCPLEMLLFDCKSRRIWTETFSGTMINTLCLQLS